MSQELLDDIDVLKIMLVTRSTGGIADNQEYKDLRNKLLKYSYVSDKLPRFIHVCRSLDEFWNFIKPKFASYHERRKYLQEQFDTVLTMLEAQKNSPSDITTEQAIRSINSDYIQEYWQKAIGRRSTDPEGAVTAARTLLESVCKHILDAKKISYQETDDLPKLYSLLANELTLSPSQHSEKLFKQILGSCQAVVGGLGALRNKHSDSHGKGLHGIRISARHAELAVNLAGAMATFILETWEVRKNLNK